MGAAEATTGRANEKWKRSRFWGFKRMQGPVTATRLRIPSVFAWRRTHAEVPEHSG